MDFFSNLLQNRTSANKTPHNFSDAVEAEAGQNSRALVEYNSKTPENDVAVTSTNLCTPRKNVPDLQEPFTPSKRQYQEVDNSITLRERNRTLMTANKDLRMNQITLVQEAEAATQQAIRAEKERKNDYKGMSQRVEEAVQQAMQAQKQREQDLEMMQLAQQKFQQEIISRFEMNLAKVKVCYFVAKMAVSASKNV